jgi:hypothetical protein
MILLWPFVLAQTLVTSAQDCPAASSVEARVREVLGLRAGSPAFEERATIDRDGASLRVTLRTHDGRVLGDRRLQADGSCQDLVGVVAVVLAAWLSDVHPEFVGALPAPAPLPAPPSAPAPIAPPGESIEARRPPRQWVLGAGIGADFSSLAPAPFVALGVGWIPERSGLGAALAATLVGARSEDLSTGSVRHWRWPLELGPVLRVPVGSAALDFGAGAALAWLHLEGSGFASSASHDAFHAGGFISTRISMRSDRFAPFAEVTGVFWGSTQAFVRRGPDELAVTLPRVEAYVAVGSSWRVW